MKCPVLNNTKFYAVSSDGYYHLLPLTYQELTVIVVANDCVNCLCDK